MPRVSWWIMSNRRYQPYVGLPNILAGEFIVPEFLQDEAIPENLSQAMLNLLFDGTVRTRLEARFAAMARELRRDSAERMASALVPMVRIGAAA
jgi:lipid-A-disaccharide synthase